MADLDDFATAVGNLIKGRALASDLDNIKLANSSVGSGPPTGTAPVGWYYTNISTGDIYQMASSGWTLKSPSFSGVYDVSGVLPSGTTGTAKLWRLGTGVALSLDSVKNSSVSGSGLVSILSLPVGMRPPALVVQQLDAASTTTRWDVTTGGTVRISGSALAATVNLTIRFDTVQAWPSSIPGVKV